MARLIISVIILFFCYGDLFAQKEKINYPNTGKRYKTSNYPSINLFYGKQYTLLTSNFQDFFHDSFDASFANNNTILGMSLTGPMTASAGDRSKAKHFDGAIGFYYGTTDKLIVADSLEFQFNALHFNLAVGKDLFYFWNNIDLPLRIGIDGGLTHFKWNGDRNRNPFLCITAQSEFRIVMKQFVFGSKFELGYDISSAKWKPKKKGLSADLGYQNHFYSFQFSIGYNLFEMPRPL